MDASYSTLAKYLTELKMDHADGTKESDRLDQFLNCNLSVVPSLHPKHPKEDACEQYSFPKRFESEIAKIDPCVVKKLVYAHR